eukprot:g63420.t1
MEVYVWARSARSAKDRDSDGQETELTPQEQKQNSSATQASDMSSEDFDSPPTLAALPPLPTPDRRRRRNEFLGGVAVVTSIVSACLAATLCVFFLSEDMALRIRVMWLVLTAVESVVAISALARIGFGDPGVVVRSVHTCFPLPAAAASCLRAGQTLPDQNNIEATHLEPAMLIKHTFCVRCWVWRPPKSHHCSICQRCVMEFDHHCAVLGRCIAGRPACPQRGNMLAFNILIAMGFTGVTTALSAVGWALGLRVGWWALLILLVGYWGINPVCAFVCYLLRHWRWCFPCLSRARRHIGQQGAQAGELEALRGLPQDDSSSQEHEHSQSAVEGGSRRVINSEEEHVNAAGAAAAKDSG